MKVRKNTSIHKYSKCYVTKNSLIQNHIRDSSPMIVPLAYCILLWWHSALAFMPQRPLQGFGSNSAILSRSVSCLRKEQFKITSMKLNSREGKTEEKDICQKNQPTHDEVCLKNRRNFVKQISLSPALLTIVGFKQNYPAQALGLVKFPCKNGFLNTYHFMRAGQTLLEEEDIWSTNPLFLTNREAALSDVGIDQVAKACKELASEGIAPTAVRYSLAASAIDTADIVGKELKVGRDRLVPEFNFMDPRAIGNWDMFPLGSTEEAVWAMDEDEAGPDGTGGRPPPNEDGTPHETLFDQTIRLRQLLSVLETQYSGDTVLLIFPDGTGPALLTCLIGGIPLNRAHQINFKPGEVRLDITYESANEMILGEIPPVYVDALDRGRQQLRILRESPDLINVKDQKYEEELRIETERQLKLEEEANFQKKLELEEKARQKEITEEKKRKRQELKSKRIEEQKGQASIDGQNKINNGDIVSDVITALGFFGAFGLFSMKENKSVDDNAYTEGKEEDAVSDGDDTNETLKSAAEAKHSNLERSVSKSHTSDPLTNSQANDTSLSEDLSNSEQDAEVEIERETNEDGRAMTRDNILSRNTVVETISSKSQTWDPNEDDGGNAWLSVISDIIEEKKSEES